MSHHLYLPDPAKPRHNQLKRLMLAVRDMNVAASALEAASLPEETEKIQGHLVSAAVIAYARPFVSGRNWAALSSKWERFDDPVMVEMHRLISDWRNAVVAHNDSELNHVEFLPKGSIMEVRPNGSPTPIKLTMSGHGEYLRTPKFPREWIEPFLALCRAQGKRMNDAVNREKEALFAEFIEPGEITPDR